MGRRMVAAEMTKACNYLLRSTRGDALVRVLNAATTWPGVRTDGATWTVTHQGHVEPCGWAVDMLVSRGLMTILGRRAKITSAGFTALFGYAARKAYDVRMAELHALAA